MKVLFFSCWYPTKENPLKGIFIKEHAFAIHNAGIDMVVLALNVSYGSKIYQKKVDVFIDENGVKTHLIQIKSLLHKWIYINTFFLYFIIRSYYFNSIGSFFTPDIIHSNVLNPCAIIGDWLAKKIQKPHVITEHWSKVDKFMNRNLLSFYGKNAYNNATAITTVSSYLKNNISKYVKLDNKIQIIPNVIDTKIFSFQMKSDNKDDLIFTAVAQWKSPKAPIFFVKALSEIQKETKKRIVLNLIGQGPLLEDIRQLKTSYSINYLGNLSKKEIASYLQQSDLFLHASKVETFSMVIAEALSTGTPVIASKVGAIPELINNTNGVLCSNTVTDWTSSIKKAMSTIYNNQQISEETQKKYDSKNIGEQFSRLYDQII